MKVLGLCAGRPNGNTEIMMKEAFMAIEEKCGATCQLIRVQETTINTCVGCESCMVNHLKGNWDFRCIHKNGSDHVFFIEQLMKAQGGRPSYVGPAGVCPDCHGNLLEIRADGVYCPQCLTKAKLSLDNGELTVEFTEDAIAKNRWSIWGKRLHDDNIRKGHAKAAAGKDLIAERAKKYRSFDRAVKLPDLVSE